LSTDKIDLLEQIDFPWSTARSANWDRQFAHLQQYREENPNRWPERDEEYPKGNKLGVWYQTQRTRYRKGKLAADRIERLRSVGFSFESLENKNWERWNTQYRLLCEFQAKHNRSPYWTEEYPDGNRIGNWCLTQRRALRTGRLEQQREVLLREIGFDFDPSGKDVDAA
jgi:hypothetical protein